jgi:fatty acid desaturase
MSLTAKFYSDRFFHIKLLIPSTAFTLMLCWLVSLIHSPSFYHFSFEWWYLLVIPLGLWVGGLSVVFIHNATHKSFAFPWLNRLCGHISGMHQLWGFTGWGLIHVFHHQYSDKPGQDPHSPAGKGFLKYALQMSNDSSQVVINRYYEQFGNTPHSRLIITCSFLLFLLLVISNLTFWYLLLGPVGMLFFYLPSYISNFWLFAHVNYYGHRIDEKTGEMHPINLSEGWYYKLANLCWFGIYFHGNHHKKPLLFNPSHMAEKQATTLAY